MNKTKDGLKILGKRAQKDPSIQQMLGEERVNLRASVLIRQAREQAGLTQGELAKQIGTTQSVISRLEDGDYTGHTLKMMQRILQVLGHNLVLSLEPAGSL